MHIFITFLLWIVFAWMLRRAFIRHRFTNRRLAFIWIQVFLALVTVSLMGETREAVIDQLFADWPVTLFVKTMAMLGMFHLYYLTLRDIDISSHRYRYLAYLGPSALVGGILYFLIYSLYPIIPKSDFRYLSLALRDAVMVAYIVPAFLPSSIRLLRLEQVGSMKVKHLASIICCLCYVGIAGANISVAVLHGLHIPQAEQLSTAFVPLVYLGALNFIVILVPHRWLVPLQYPIRLYRWWRINRLEVRIQAFGTAKPMQAKRSLRDLLPSQLELTIYRSVILILDYHPLIRNHQEGEILYHQIQRVVQSTQPYSDLVNALSELV